MEEIFLVRRITPHERAIGTDCWIFFDSGLAAHLMGTTLEDGRNPVTCATLPLE
jgi:hypothetical protein